jgi:hypothetical protein
MNRQQFLAGMTFYGARPNSYGSSPYFDKRTAGRVPQDVFDNPDKYVFSTSAYAPSAEYESAGFQGSARIGSGRGQRGGTAYLFRKKTPVEPTTNIEMTQPRLHRLQSCRSNSRFCKTCQSTSRMISLKKKLSMKKELVA